MIARREKSKRRSGANSSSTGQPNGEGYEFFIDECIAGRHVAAMLGQAGYTAHVQGPATFGTGTLDADWLPEVGARRWILITKDKNIRRRETELRALHQAQVRTFVLTAHGLTGEAQARVLREALPAMLRLLRRRAAHFIARITAESNVEVIEITKYVRH